MTLNQKHIPQGSGETYDVIGGDRVTLKIVGSDTAGTLALHETLVPAQAGPPRHVHHRESETFYILEGTFEFEVDGIRSTVSPGAVVFAPQDIPHQFRNTTDQPGKILVVCQPAGFEHFIREFATIPTTVPPDPAQMAAIAARHGIEFLPPA
ncbi:MAG: cupin domain-containing protein [Planctomycetaceae bacterium]